TSLGKADSAVQTVTSNDPNLTAVKTGNNVVFDFADAPTFTGQVKAVGFDASNQKIVNVQDGSDAKDAVNKGQLDALATAGSTKTDALGNSTASNLGGGATYDDKTGAVSAPTYKVNGNDSNNVGDAISALDQGFTLKTNGADGAAVKAGDTIDIGTAAGENNLEVVKSANTIKYSLKKNLDLGATGSVTTGNTVTDNVGVTVNDKDGNVTKLTTAGTQVKDNQGNATNYGAKGLTFLDTNGAPITNAPSITKAGIDAGSKKITNVAPGTVAAGSTDAINGDQLNTTNQSIAAAQGQIDDGINFGDGATSENYKLGDTINVKGDSNVTSVTTKDGVQLGLADKISVQQVTVGDATNSTVLTSTANGLDVGGDKITNVADGTTAKDAVNKGQLDALATASSTKTDALGNSTASNLGGGAQYDASTGAVSAPTYSVNGANSNNVGDAISALDQGFTLQTNGATGAAVKAGDTIDIGTATGENNLEVVKSGNTIKYSLKKNLDLGATGSVTTGNTVTNNDGVTINDKTGNVTQMTAAGTNVTDGTNTSNYGAAGSTVTDGANTTTTGPEGITVSNGKDTSNIAADNITVGGANPVVVNGKDGVITGLTNTTYDETKVVRNRVATEGQVSDVASSLGDLADTPLTFTGNSGSTAQKLGSTLNISGGAANSAASSNTNVKTVITDGKVDIQLLDAPTFTGQVKANGFDASNQKIVNVQDGSDAKDAVNKGQLDALATAGSTKTDALGNSTASNLGGGAQYDASTGAVSAPTYSVNGANSNNVGNAISALDQGFMLQTNGTDAAAVKAGDTIDIGTAAGENNLEVVKSANTIKYSLKKNLDLGAIGSVTTGNTVTNNAGVTVDDKTGNITQITAAGTKVTDGTNTTNYGAEGLTFLDTNGAPITNAPSITKAGISAGNQKITNVAPGSVAAGSTDAINGNQLNTTNEAVSAAQGEVNKGINFGDGATNNNYKLGDTINVKGDSNVTSVTTKDGVQLGLADKISVQQVTVGDATNSTVLTSTANGLDVGGDKITNVADGTATKDAVNKGQLDALATAGSTKTDALGNSTAINLGGGAQYDASTGAVSAPTYSVNGTNSNNVGDAISALDQGFTLQTNGKNAAAVKAGDTIDIGTADAENNLEVVKTDNTIKYSLKKNLDLGATGSVTTGNTVTNNTGVTVNDKDGNVTKLTTAGTQVKDNQGNATNYGAKGLTFLDTNGAPITNAPSITKTGISAGNQKITNVAPGSVAAGSTDAINGDQLNTTNEAVSAAQGEVNKGINFGDGATNNNYKLGDTINVKGDSNVTSVTTKDGVQLGLADKISVQQVTVGDATNSIVLTSTTNGLDVGGDKITNVADGTTAKDAVNKGQLDALATAGSTKTDALGNSTASNLGGGAQYDASTGAVSAPTYSVNGANSNNVGDAISALDQGFTLQTNGATAAAVKAGDTIDIGTAVGENNLEVVKTDNTIKYSLKKNLDLGATGSVTTGNTVTNNAGVTVDDGEGNVTALTKAGTNVTDGTNTSNYGATGSTVTDGTNTTNTTAQGTTVTDGTNTTSYGAEGLTFLDSKTGTALAGTPNITKAGISAGNTVIKNVAAGNVAKDSTDAINGNQLFETNQAIANAQGQANKGFNIAADNGTPDNVQLGETVKYTNKDSNLVATVSDNGINYDLAEDINVKSVTADDGEGNVTKLDSTGTKVKDAAGNNSSYNAMGSTIIDTKGNTNASTAAGNTLKDDAGNETITAADGTNVKDAVGNASNYGAAGSKITDADGNETTTAANGTKVKDINGNESVYGAAGSTITDDAGNTNVSKATGNTIVDTAGNQTMTAANGMTVQDGKGNATSYGAEGLTFINTTTGEAIANTPSITKGGINAGNTVIRNVASGLEGKTVEQIKAEGSSSAQWKNAATVGDLTQVQGNVTNVTNNVTNISQALGAKDGLVDDKGNLTQAGKDALITYNVADQAEFINNSVIGAINKMNEEGIKFIHVNDETAGSEIPKQATNSIDSSAGGAYSTAIGYQAKVGNQATNGIAIGKGATVTGKDSIAIGTGNVVTGTGSGAIGDPSTVTGDSSYSLGNNNTVATDNSFVIGNDVTKTAENSVNLGSKSAASTEASSSTAGTTVYNQSKINGETYNYAGGTAAGVVSVGDVDAERRIQNVAAGLISKDSTDAINGSQLYGTNQAIEALKNNIGTTTGNVSKGVNFGNGSAANNYQLGDTINVKGDKNVTSTTTTDGVQLGLADNITVKSVAAQTVTADDGKGNSATLTANGTSVKDAAGNTSNYGAAGSTVADKEGNKATTAANGVTVSNAKNSTVYGADGMTFVDNNGTAITKAPSVTVQGINAGNQQITNVAEGKITEGSNDAVNGGQLYNTNQAITKVANSVDDLGYKLDGVQEEANAGISSAMAMASMPQAFLPGKSMISGGIATYNGEGAVAVGMSKLSDNGRWVIKINGSADTKGNAGAAAGVGMHW
ncbi:YadA-like family protein, partial [Psychrobacter arenosus]